MLPVVRAVGMLFGRAWTWSSAHTDKLVHLVLGFSLLSMSARLVTQKHRLEDEHAGLQQLLEQDVKESERRRQRLLLQAPARNWQGFPLRRMQSLERRSVPSMQSPCRLQPVRQKPCRDRRRWIHGPRCLEVVKRRPSQYTKPATVYQAAAPLEVKHVC